MMVHLMEHMGSSFVSFTHTLMFSYVLVREVMFNTADGAKNHATIFLGLSKFNATELSQAPNIFESSCI